MLLPETEPDKAHASSNMEPTASILVDSLAACKAHVHIHLRRWGHPIRTRTPNKHNGMQYNGDTCEWAASWMQRPLIGGRKFNNSHPSSSYNIGGWVPWTTTPRLKRGKDIMLPEIETNGWELCSHCSCCQQEVYTSCRRHPTTWSKRKHSCTQSCYGYIRTPWTTKSNTCDAAIGKSYSELHYYIELHVLSVCTLFVNEDLNHAPI